MLYLTGIKGQKLELEVSTIEEIKLIPDTLLLIKGGNKLIVRETAEEIRTAIKSSPMRLAARMTRGII